MTSIHRRLPRVAALAAVLCGAALVGLAAQPPKEEEDPKGGVKKKVIVDDDLVVGKTGVGSPSGISPDVRLDELVRAAEETRNADLKRVFAKYAVPADRLTEAGGVLSIKPIPFRKVDWPAGTESVLVTPFDNAGKPRDPRAAAVKDIRNIDYFEALVLTDADAITKQKAEGAALLDNLAAAEKLLAAAMRFHDYARERNIRKGKGWDDLRTAVSGKLKEVRLDYLRAALTVNDTLRVREASTKLMHAYPKDAVVAQAVAVARIGEAERLVKSNNHLDHVRAKELLDEFEARFPGASGEAAKQVRAQLREIAQKAFTRAREKKALGDLTTARDELARAGALDPTIEGVREMQRELRVGYPILYVGVRQFPANLSPATARLDSELQVVELVFEGLLEEVPEEGDAVGYRPGAALAMPLPVPGARDFVLRAFDRDSLGRPGFDSHDVVGTVKLLRSRSETWAAYPLAWLATEPPAPKDAGAVRVPFGLAHPDPRAALTFKLLPTRWMTDNARPVDDPGFAEKPFGTGPFKLHAVTNPGRDTPREMIFVDSPDYGRWRDRTGLPQLREIRLIDVAKLDTITAFSQDKLHILPDVPTNELDRYMGPGSGLANKVRVVTSSSNRRVHILAVNLNRPYLQNRAIRQGLSMAIDREDILREVFRAGRPEFHRAMTGPFPPGSWAGGKGPGSGAALVNRDLAVARLKAYLADPGARNELSLAYPEDDPRAVVACGKIKTHIEGLLRDSPRKLLINLEPVPLRELMTRVQDEHRYDLAYVPFDYPDDWHPFALGAMLDPSAAGRGGRNWFGFGVRETNPDADDQRLGQVLNELRSYRDPAQLAARAADAGKLFNDCLPFIPLWQLDRHMVVHNALKVYVDDTPEPVHPRVLNPTPLFQGVARWRLE
jgi:ABC-type oligopeptide transport system substrate-binding subunit